MHEIAAPGTDDKVSNFPEHYHEKSTVETVRYSQTNGYKQISSAAQIAVQIAAQVGCAAQIAARLTFHH